MRSPRSQRSWVLAAATLSLWACPKPSPAEPSIPTKDASAAIAPPSATALTELAFSDFARFHAAIDGVDATTRSTLANAVVAQAIKSLDAADKAPQAVRVLMFLERYLEPGAFTALQKTLGDWAFAGLDWNLSSDDRISKLTRIAPGYYERLGEHALLPAALAVAQGLRTHDMLDVLTAPTGPPEKRAPLLARAIHEGTVKRGDAWTPHIVALAMVPHKTTAEALLAIASTTTIYAYRNQSLALAEAMFPKLPSTVLPELKQALAAVRARPLQPKSPLGTLGKGAPWEVPSIPTPKEPLPRPASRVPQPRKMTLARSVAPRPVAARRPVHLQIANNAIELGTRRVATVDVSDAGPTLDPAYLEDASSGSYLVPPLFERLETDVRRLKEQAKETGRPADLVARLTPHTGTTFELMAKAIHTGGMAGIERWELSVSGPDPQKQRTIKLSTPKLDEACLEVEGRERRPRKSGICMAHSFVTVLVRRDALRLTVRDQRRNNLPKPEVFEAKPGGPLPLHRVYNRLRALRADAPHVTELNVGAMPDIRWQTVVDVIDASTVRRAADRYDSLDAYRRAQVPNDWDARFSSMVFVVPE